MHGREVSCSRRHDERGRGGDVGAVHSSKGCFGPSCQCCSPELRVAVSSPQSKTMCTSWRARPVKVAVCTRRGVKAMRGMRLLGYTAARIKVLTAHSQRLTFRLPLPLKTTFCSSSVLLGGCGTAASSSAYRNADRRMIARQGLDSSGGYARLPVQGQKTLLHASMHAIMPCNACRRGERGPAPADGRTAQQGLKSSRPLALGMPPERWVPWVPDVVVAAESSARR